MTAEIVTVKHTATQDGAPLVCFTNLPGPDVELAPEAIRHIAAALMTIADDCEAHARSIRRGVDVRRQYTVEV